MKTYHLTLVVFLIFMFLAGAVSAYIGLDASEIKNFVLQNSPTSLPAGGFTPAPVAPTANLDREIKMVFVGDIMLSRKVGEMLLVKNDFGWPFRLTQDYLQSFDVAFGNLETTVSDRGTRVGSIYSFRSDPRVAPALASAGFDVMSIANNHIWDYARDAFLDTLSHLERNGIGYVGGGYDSDDAHDGYIKYVDGVRIGFLAYTNLLPKSVSATPVSAGVSYLNIEQVKIDIAAMRPHVDVLVVSFHLGDEYKTTHNAVQESVAKTSLEAGADLIIGHHPHVRQEIVDYQGKTIAYSLGNFIFDQDFSKETMTGKALEVTIKNNKITAVNGRDVSISKEYQASIIPDINVP